MHVEVGLKWLELFLIPWTVSNLSWYPDGFVQVPRPLCPGFPLDWKLHVRLQAIRATAYRATLSLEASVQLDMTPLAVAPAEDIWRRNDAASTFMSVLWRPPVLKSFEHTFVCMYAMEGQQSAAQHWHVTSTWQLVVMRTWEEGEIPDKTCMSSHHTDQYDLKYSIIIEYWSIFND